ncbi:putative Poly(A) RNA polymerase cid11 [Glarea lozoyensis 74030]|uniref:polynucleotide adenylyltransferase n=1 Tax=Glarea lozoyensis (strain ATCC 74030 / MF5533) TaxID=1104152 RepID=H0EL67_GLAL7|nr:putative Poly(A) RNA polymerase cid11 [Glarea lozoyensis 74030]
MRELYDRLLPTQQSEARRKELIVKLERLFNEEWPGHVIKVHVFGSSGNLLCTDESDVDICITTDAKEMEGVCLIADLLARNGMQKVICVSTAKVPIVKIWDPELRLSCDMNVNNPLALENTRMIKTYVQIDPRVRPLAMIVKHWTKRRIVNDAEPHASCTASTAPTTAYEAASEGRVRKFYGHEFDYDKHVVSVRNGKQISKIEKKWHLANNNTLGSWRNVASSLSFRKKRNEYGNGHLRSPDQS